MKQAFIAILVFIGSAAITDLSAQCCASKAGCNKASASVEKSGEKGNGVAVFASQTTTVEKNTNNTGKACAAACTQGAKAAASAAGGEKTCNPADCDPSKKCVPANCDPANCDPTKCKVASKGI